jgi:hypothetical protein
LYYLTGMDMRPTSDMTREDLEREVELLRAELKGRTAPTSATVKSSVRDQDDSAKDGTDESLRVKRARRFLDDLGRLSARHGVWIENGARGTLLYLKDSVAAGYIAWPRQVVQGGDTYEIDSYVRGAVFHEADCIVGDDHSPEGKIERAQAWREENAAAIEEQNCRSDQDLQRFSELSQSIAKRSDEE